MATLVERKFKRLCEKILEKTPTVKSLKTEISKNQLQRIVFTVNKYGYSVKQFQEIFEFGCRDGRLIKLMGQYHPHAKLFGCDIDVKALKKCRNNVPQGDFFRNEVKPPLRIDDESFDFIFSYSVFTHLTEENQKNWLKELGRILKPGGLSVHTIHTCESLRRMKEFSPESLVKYNLGDDVDEFIKTSKLFYYTVDNKMTPEYGLSIQHPDYIHEYWPKYSGLKLIAYEAGAIEAFSEGCQDLVLLSKNKK